MSLVLINCLIITKNIMSHFTPVERSCNDATSEKNATFTSPGYPGPTVGNIVCQYEVHIQAGICAVR